jgi:hypothetical protein
MQSPSSASTRASPTISDHEDVAWAARPQFPGERGRLERKSVQDATTFVGFDS